MDERFSRTELLFGAARMARLEKAHVAVFGLGGVGGFAAEALARSGIGALTLVDHDEVSLSNCNRQILALSSTVGRAKVDVAEERIREINPACQITTKKVFFLPENEAEFDFSAYDYVVDAIDTVTGKLALARCCQAAGTPILCALGTGNKRDPSQLRVADVFETSVDPLARIMRKECRKRGIRALKVVYSLEEPTRPDPAGEAIALAQSQQTGSTRRDIPGSTAFVPASAGLLLASALVSDLLSEAGEKEGSA